MGTTSQTKIVVIFQTVRNIWPCSSSGCIHRGLPLLCITVCNMLNRVRIMSRSTPDIPVRDITRLINKVLLDLHVEAAEQ